MSQQRLEEWLKSPSRSGGLAVLRHRLAESDESVRRPSDWDLAVRDRTAMARDLEEAFGTPDLTIRRRYVEQRFYPWNQVDFLPVFEWNGLVYLDAERFWSKVARDGDGLPRPCLAHDAFLAWITGILSGGVYKRRYDPLLAEAWECDGVEFRECLREAFGVAWAGVLGRMLGEGRAADAAAAAPGLRKALWLRRLVADPGGSVLAQAGHWWRELKHHVAPPFPWIAFLGPDGSGKSSVVGGVTARLEARRLYVKMIHWRPDVLRKRQEVEGGVVTDPHAKDPRGALVSLVKLCYMNCEWWLASLWNLRHPRAKDRLLLSDRYYDDMLVDPRRYRYGASAALARRFFRLLPKPDLVIILAGDPATIHARKREVTLAEVERQVAAYRSLGESLGAKAAVIDAALPLDEVVDAAYRQVIVTLRGYGQAR